MKPLQLAAMVSLALTLIGGVALILGLMAVDSHKAKTGLAPAGQNTIASLRERDQIAASRAEIDCRADQCQDWSARFTTGPGGES